MPGVGYKSTNLGLAIFPGAVLPLYPALFVICQKIGKYDVVCEELSMLRDEHERTKEKYQ